MYNACNSCHRKIKYKTDSELSKPPLDQEIIALLNNGFSMIKSFALSMSSRGLNNKKVDIPVKQLRVLSCFGDNIDIPKCPYLRNSSTEGKFYCGKCGCGDKERTWLLSENEEYSKLDYPSLSCPEKMVGFSNYVPYEDGDNIRKKQIENYNMNKLTQITVSSPDKK